MNARRSSFHSLPGDIKIGILGCLISFFSSEKMQFVIEAFEREMFFLRDTSTQYQKRIIFLRLDVFIQLDRFYGDNDCAAFSQV